MAAMMPEGTAIRMPTTTLATTRMRVGTKASSTSRLTRSWFR